MTAVRGTFADAKSIKTRGVYQLIIEIPLESADHALAVLGGVPQPKAEQWVGIAPVTAPEKPQDEHTTPEAETPEEPERVKGGARVKRAGILCKDAAFQKWLDANHTAHWTGSSWVATEPKDRAATVIRNLCKVDSRAELDHNEDAGRIWDRIIDDYYASQRGETPEALAEQARMR